MSNEKLLIEYREDVQKLNFNDSTHLDKINRDGEMLIRNMCGIDSPYLKDLKKISFHTNYYPSSDEADRERWNKGQQQVINLINTILNEFSLFRKENKDLEKTLQLNSNKVFIVHGHDSELKNDVERFVHEIGLEPIVLHRQADKGATIIEKFEEHSNVGYVFVLLTPDEIAYTVDQDPLSDPDRKKERRARPNVIFEFGYFVGKLGRERVCCLHKGETAIPSDLSGLIYKKIEGTIETQAYSIIKELKAAGFDVSI